MKILLDENFPLALYRTLTADGEDVEHIITLGNSRARRDSPWYPFEISRLGVLIPKLFPRSEAPNAKAPYTSPSCSTGWRSTSRACGRRCLALERMLALLASGGTRNVAQLMVRNVDDAVVRELKKRAARRNHSAEQEHREILEQALLRPRRRSLAEVLAAMPDAGEDADFERRQIDRRA